MMTKPLVNSLPDCPVETTVLLLGSKWNILILRDLLQGPLRFTELQRSIGSISQKVLTSKLREMEERGIIHRQIFPEVPLRVEYSLTELGLTPKPIIDSMYQWGEWYKNQISYSTDPSFPR